MWGEVTDKIRPAARDRLAPNSRIVFELRFFGWIDVVANDAGDHG